MLLSRNLDKLVHPSHIVRTNMRLEALPPDLRVVTPHHLLRWVYTERDRERGLRRWSK